MKAFQAFVKGKKTYAIAIVLLVATVLKSNGVDIPEEAWSVLAALGLAFLRAGVKKVDEVEV